MKTNRITSAILCVMAIILFISASACNAKKKDETPKYVFLFIGDGMSYNSVALAESYLSYKNGKLGGVLHYPADAAVFADEYGQVGL